MRVSREVAFTARHSHKGMLLEPKHAHEYTVRVVMEGEPNEEGFVCDFRAVKRLFKRIVVGELSNRDLDEIFEYPTSECLAQWIWDKLDPFLPLHSIEIREKPHSAVVYFGPAPSSPETIQ